MSEAVLTGHWRAICSSKDAFVLVHVDPSGASQVDARSHARLAHVFHQRRDKNALTYHDYQAAHQLTRRDANRFESSG